MADDVSPEQTRARQFDVVRRGYDRAQVDAYLDELRDKVASLEAAVGDADAETLALGIDDREALANELHKVGGEVATILEAARAAAEGIRTRASVEAKKWRADAEAETSASLTSAREQTQALRSGAWNEGTALLNSALGEATKIKATAQEDAMFMRAEAERDALRLTSDARRDKEEALRAARQEAEVILAEARAESDGVLAAAQKQADLAQERARALEDRRSELLSELEATRASISHLEEEIDSRRQELETPPEPEPEMHDEEMRHGLDSGSVKIVAPSKARTLRPVDPDEIVAEVTAMRASSAQRAATELAEMETVAVISPPEPVPIAPESVQSPDPALSAEATAAVPDSHPEPELPAEPETKPSAMEVSTGKTSDEIGSLFAALRSADGPPAVPAETTVQPETHVVPPVSAAIHSAADPEPEPAAAPRVTPEKTPGPVADVADSATLGARNAALKEIKRSLVELQNETLEALRTNEDWTPDDDFTDRFVDAFTSITGSIGGGDANEAAAAFASDLQDSVMSALEDARSSGKGSRAVAAAASKVFRTWRSDEAERRLQKV
jgi:DivIVA domain-containing protein